MKQVLLDVFSNRDGITVCPVVNKQPDSQRRVYLGETQLQDLNQVQLLALTRLAFRDAKLSFKQAAFCDGDRWARTDRRYLLLVLEGS